MPALPEKGARHRGWSAAKTRAEPSSGQRHRPSLPAFSSPAEATIHQLPVSLRNIFVLSHLFQDLFLLFFSQAWMLPSSSFLHLFATAVHTAGNDFLCGADKANDRAALCVCPTNIFLSSSIFCHRNCHQRHHRSYFPTLHYRLLRYDFFLLNLQ